MNLNQAIPLVSQGRAAECLGLEQHYNCVVMRGLMWYLHQGVNDLQNPAVDILASSFICMQVFGKLSMHVAIQSAKNKKSHAPLLQPDWTREMISSASARPCVT